jgi:hypothetical protein
MPLDKFGYYSFSRAFTKGYQPSGEKEASTLRELINKYRQS